MSEYPVGGANRPNKPEREPVPGGRGLNIHQRYALERQRAEERGAAAPSFEQYVGDTFESTAHKPAPSQAGPSSED